MVIVKGIALQLVNIVLVLVIILFLYGYFTGSSGNLPIIIGLGLLWLVVREAYRRLK